MSEAGEEYLRLEKTLMYTTTEDDYDAILECMTDLWWEMTDEEQAEADERAREAARKRK